MQIINNFKVDILPLDIWYQIYQKLSDKDLRILSCVSKDFQKLTYTLQIHEAKKKCLSSIYPIKMSLILNLDTSLMRAIKSCQSEFVKCLLDKNDVFIDVNENRGEPLRQAIANDDIKIVEILLAHKQIMIDHFLSEVARKNNFPMLKIFLNSQSFLNSEYKNQNIHAALGKAAYQGYYEIACELLKYYVPGFYFGENPLTLSVEKGHYNISEILLNSEKIEVPSDILYSAVKKNNLDIIILLLKSCKVDINYNDSSALKLAISNHNNEAVKVILEHPDTFLDESITSDNLEIALQIKNYFDSINEGKIDGIGQLDPIYLEPISEENLIFWKENGVMQYFNKESLAQHIAINSPINPLTRQKIPERIIRAMSITITIASNMHSQKISIPRQITIGLFILNIWRRFKIIPDKLDKTNFYLNYSGRAQHLLGRDLFRLPSLFDLEPQTKLCSLPGKLSDLRIEVSSKKEASNQIKLNKIIPYLRSAGIEWI